MIPKIIHYVWLSGDLPEAEQKRVTQWKAVLPDYEFKLWGKEDIKDISNIFLTEAIEAQKWAFATDFLRLYILYNFGGIYLDSDVILLKDFDAFLSNPAFIGKESSLHINGGSQEQYLTAHCFGAEPHNPFIKKCLDYYADRHFILSQDAQLPNTLKYDMTLMPFIMSEIAKMDGYNPLPLSQEKQNLEDIVVFPSSYFDAAPVRKESVAVHLALGSWREGKRFELSYNLSYKISWRLMSLIEKILSPWHYKIIKLRDK